jgi:hypothetical protein
VERGAESSLLRVSVRSNPPSTVSWQIDGRNVSRFDRHFTFHQDGSLEIHKVNFAKQL